MAKGNYTPEQIKVIEHAGGHVVVSAVAGSGITKGVPGTKVSPRFHGAKAI